MSIGIRNVFRQSASLSVAASVVPVNTGIVIPVGAGRTVQGIIKGFLTVGAAGGVRFLFTTPTTPANFVATFSLANTVAPSLATAIQLTPAAFTNALANAGNHFIDINFSCTAGTAAGNLTLQFAQNTSDNTAAQFLIGSFAEVIIL